MSNKNIEDLGASLISRLSQRNVSDKEIESILAKAHGMTNLSSDELREIEALAGAKKSNKEIVYNEEGNEKGVSGFVKDRLEDAKFAVKFGSFLQTPSSYNEIAEYVENNPEKAGPASRFLMRNFMSRQPNTSDFRRAVEGVLNADPKYAQWGIDMINAGLKFDKTQSFSFELVSFMAENNPETHSQLVDIMEKAPCKVQNIAEYSNAVASVACMNDGRTEWGCDIIRRSLDSSLQKNGVVYDGAFAGLETMVKKNPSNVSSVMDVLTDEKYAKAELGEIPMFYYYDRAIRASVNADKSYATQELYDLVHQRHIPEGGNYSTGWEASLDTMKKVNPDIKTDKKRDRDIGIMIQKQRVQE